MTESRDASGELKWRGTPLSQLSDADVIRAHMQGMRYVSALIEEQQRRGLFGDRGAKLAKDVNEGRA